MTTAPNGREPLDELFGFVKAAQPLLDTITSLAGQVNRRPDGAPQEAPVKATELPSMLAAAKKSWDDGLKQSDLSGKEREFLRGQAELIVNYLLTTGELEFTELAPDTGALVHLVAGRIVGY